MRTTALWILLVAIASSQVVSFPSSHMDFIRSRWDTWRNMIPDVYGSCHESVTKGPRYVTRRISGGDYAFRATTNQGVIAVFKKTPPLGSVPHAGIDTGFANILHLDTAREQAWLPPGFLAIVITGYTGSTAGFKLFTLNTSLPLAAGALTDLPSTVTSAPGEVFVSASLIGSTLYVLEGVALKVVRFVDSNMDFLPDSRDDTCEVKLPFPQAGASFIESFHPHPALAAMISNSFQVRSDVRYGIEDVSGGQSRFVRIQGPRALATGPFPPKFRRCPSRGHDRVYIDGDSNGLVIVEKGPAELGPWTTVSTSPIAVTTRGLGHIGLLSTALVSGEYVRLTCTSNSLSSPAFAVCAAAPVVFSPNGSSLTGPTSLVLEGDGLDGAVTVTLRVPGGGSPIPIPITAQSKHSLTLTIPAVTKPTSGFLDIQKTGSGSGRASAFLFVRPQP